jgi:probable phosphomutase (TIGR03848 family)
MAVFLLIRHGYTDMVDVAIAGRMPGIHLNSRGKEQAANLAGRLKRVKLDAVISSPLERTVETAEPLAANQGLPVRIYEGFNEIEFGEWTGWEVPRLRGPTWESYNAFRSGTRIPGGEMMIEVQSRMVSGLEKLYLEFPRGMVAVVSHADPIKAAIVHFAGIPLDLFLRLDISPASLSVVKVEAYGPRICRLNDTGDLPFRGE